MKISQKGLYALQAMMMLARHYNQGAIRIRDIAYEEVLPEKFLELILLELKNARIVDSARGAKGRLSTSAPPCRDSPQRNHPAYRWSPCPIWRCGAVAKFDRSRRRTP